MAKRQPTVTASSRWEDGGVDSTRLAAARTVCKSEKKIVGGHENNGFVWGHWTGSKIDRHNEVAAHREVHRFVPNEILKRSGSLPYE